MNIFTTSKHGVGLLFSKEDLSVRKVVNPTDVDGRSMQHVIESGDLLCFISDKPVKKMSKDVIQQLILGEIGSVLTMSFMSRRHSRMYDLNLARFGGSQVWSFEHEVGIVQKMDPNTESQSSEKFARNARKSRIGCAGGEESRCNDMLVLCAAQDQAMATRTSSINFLQRTIRHLQGENDQIRQELSELKQSYETQLLQNHRTDPAQSEREILMLRAEIQQLKEKQRSEMDRMTKILVEQVEENQARAEELAALHTELATLRDWQANLAHLTMSSRQRAVTCGAYPTLLRGDRGEPELVQCSPGDDAPDASERQPPASIRQAGSWFHGAVKDAVADSDISDSKRAGGPPRSGGRRRDGQRQDGGARRSPASFSRLSCSPPPRSAQGRSEGMQEAEGFAWWDRGDAKAAPDGGAGQGPPRMGPDVRVAAAPDRGAGPHGAERAKGDVREAAAARVKVDAEEDWRLR